MTPIRHAEWKWFNGGLLIAVLAACGSGSAATIAPTPAPTWTQADSDACVTAELQFLDWNDEVGATAYALYWRDLGEVATARKQAGAAAAKYLKLAKAMTVPSAVQPQLLGVEDALTKAIPAFQQKQTKPEFKATYKTIEEAYQAFGDACDQIENWVEANVPQ